jgi:hypothetical protein
LRQQERELTDLAIQVVVVTFEKGWIAEAYVRETSLPWPMLVDEDRRLYAEYGMVRGRWRDILGPAAWRAYASLLLRGRRVRRATGDVTQLGGDVLIDPAGVVRLHHMSSGPADRPSVESILQVAKERNHHGGTES